MLYLFKRSPLWLASCRDRGLMRLDDFTSYAVWNFHVPARATQIRQVYNRQRTATSTLFLVLFTFTFRCPVPISFLSLSLYLLLPLLDSHIFLAVAVLPNLMC